MLVYVHVPFCARRCSYCDFAIAVRRTVPSDRFVETVLAEYSMRREREAWQLGHFETVYLGGGTPSLLSPDGIARLLDTFPRSPGAEVTLEANPDDVTPERAAAWVGAGVTRISLGHNELYGALGVASAESIGKYRSIVLLYLKLKNLRSFRLLRDMINGVVAGAGKLLGKESLQDPTATLMERLVADQNIVYKSGLYERGKKQFKENLRSILGKAKKRQIPVVLSELVSNVRDQQPFVSITAGQWPPADQVYQSAREDEQRGNFSQAREKYYLAKDLDALRFRASEEFNDIIRELGTEYQLPLVPMIRIAHWVSTSFG